MGDNKRPYTISRLNDSTYLIIQNDKYEEFPYIYVKRYKEPAIFVVIDTGCGAHNGKDDLPETELKDFIEEKLRVDNTEPAEFIVICTHCHFDHIGGIEAFAEAGAAILASAYDPLFLDPENRSGNSLCDAFKTKTPKYNITKYLFYGEKVEHRGTSLGLMALHTPGHTPDSLAIYDEQERWLFTGDTIYKRVATMPWGERQAVPIILPLQGDWKAFVASIKKLLGFVNHEDQQSASGHRIRLAAGHTTSDAVAGEALQSALRFVRRIEKDEVPVMAKVPGNQVAPGGSLGDVAFWLWQDEGEPEYSLMAPETFRKDFTPNAESI